MIWAFSLLFLDESGLSTSFILSKNQLLVSLIYYIALYSLYFTYFCSDVYCLFPSINFGFYFFRLLLILLGVKVRLFWIFLITWSLYCYKLPSRTAFEILHLTCFESLCLHFHLFPGIIFISSWFIQLPIGCWAAYCIASVCLGFLLFCPCIWFPVLC